MKIRVSVVEFLNTAPLVWGFTHGPLAGRYDLTFTVPSLCAEQLRTGRVDVAIIPAVEYQRMDGMVMLPEMAVAAKGQVRSILILAKKPIELARRIALDTDSRSSVALTRLLCRGLWGIAPEFVDAAPDPAAMLANADAALLIGDPALQIRFTAETLAARRENAGSCGELAQAAGDSAGTSADAAPGAEAASQILGAVVPGVEELFVYDVAQQWQMMTGKPCVLAAWVGRREVITADVVSDFLASKEYGLAHVGEIAEQAALQLGLPPRYLETYLRENIDFSLDDENLRGLRLYFEQCAEANLIPQARPIEFAQAPERAGRFQGTR